MREPISTSGSRLPKILSVCLFFLTACSTQDSANTYVGYIEADWVYIAAPKPGWVLKKHVNEGDQVTVGQVLFELDSDQQQAQLARAASQAKQASAQAKDIESGARPSEIALLMAQLRQVQANLAATQSEHDRVIPLLKSGAESALRGDQVIARLAAARAAVGTAQQAVEVANLAGREQTRAAATASSEAAAASVDEAQWWLQQRQVRALVGGRVEEIFHWPGEYVNSNAPLLALLPDDGLKVRFYVPQARLPELQKGHTISVTADGLDMPINARVFHIASSVEFTPPVIYSIESRQKLVFMVEARLPKGANLAAGLPVDVQL